MSAFRWYCTVCPSYQSPSYISVSAHTIFKTKAVLFISVLVSFRKRRDFLFFNFRTLSRQMCSKT